MRRAPGPAAHPLDSLDARLHSGKHHPHIRSQGWPLATKLSWENICGPNIRLRALQMIGVADELEVASEILHLLTGPIVPKAGQVGANLVLLGGEHHELSVGQPAAVPAVGGVLEEAGEEGITTALSHSESDRCRLEASLMPWTSKGPKLD